MRLEGNNDPYEVILEKMREYPSDIPMKNGKISEAFRAYIKLLFTPEEAEIAQHLETMPLPLSEICKRIGKSEKEAEAILGDITEKGTIHDIAGYSFFMVMPHLLNTGFKYSKAFERLGKKGAELFQQFFVNEGFYRRYESSDAGTPQTRIIPISKSIAHETEISNAEEIHRIIDDCMDPIVITDCPCRGRTELLEIRECKDTFPIKESCFQLGFFGQYFLRIGAGRELSREEAHGIVDTNAELGMIFTTDNSAAPGHQVICCCCGCCCSLLKGMTRFDDKNENCTARSNYMAQVDQNLCSGCGLCEDRCVFNSISIDDERSSVNTEKCFGCGVCAVTCPTEAIRLHRHERSHIYENPMELMAKIYQENRE